MEKTGFTKGVFVKKDYNNYGDEIISVSVKIEDFDSIFEEQAWIAY